MNVHRYNQFNKITEAKNSKGFKEITFTIPDDDGNEVMFDIEIETGKVIDLYCYADSIPLASSYVFGDDDAEPRYMRVKDGKNPAFKHIAISKKNLDYLVTVGYPLLETEEDFLIGVKMLKKYDLDVRTANDWEVG